MKSRPSISALISTAHKGLWGWGNAKGGHAWVRPPGAVIQEVPAKENETPSHSVASCLGILLDKLLHILQGPSRLLPLEPLPDFPAPFC